MALAETARADSKAAFKKLEPSMMGKWVQQFLFGRTQARETSFNYMTYFLRLPRRYVIKPLTFVRIIVAPTGHPGLHMEGYC